MINVKLTIIVKRLLRVNPSGWLRWWNLLSGASAEVTVWVDGIERTTIGFTGKIGTEDSKGRYVRSAMFQIKEEDLDKALWVTSTCNGFFEFDANLEYDRD